MCGTDSSGGASRSPARAERRSGERVRERKGRHKWRRINSLERLAPGWRSTGSLRVQSTAQSTEHRAQRKRKRKGARRKLGSFQSVSTPIGPANKTSRWLAGAKLRFPLAVWCVKLHAERAASGLQRWAQRKIRHANKKQLASCLRRWATGRLSLVHEVGTKPVHCRKGRTRGPLLHRRVALLQRVGAQSGWRD